MKHIKTLKSLTLSCLFVLGVLLGGVAATAAPMLIPITTNHFGSPQMTKAYPTAQNEKTVENEIPNQKPSADDNDDSPMLRATIRQDFLVNDITVYPLVSCVEDQTMQAWSSPFRRQHRWTDNQPRFQTLHLSSAQTTDFYAAIDAAIKAKSQQTGKTYQFEGWALDMEFQIQAQKPRYLKLTPTATCIEGTSPKIYDISYQYATHNMRLSFRADAVNSGKRQYWGFDGGWFFLYPSGSLGSLGVSAGFSTNSN